MEKNKTLEFFADEKVHTFFVENMRKESSKSLMLGTTLFLFFSFLLYVREGSFNFIFLLEMIFPFLFYSLVFLLRDFWLIPKAINKTLTHVKINGDTLELTTSTYIFFFITFNKKNQKLNLKNIKIKIDDYFIKNKDYEGKTIILESENLKFYLLPNFFPESLGNLLIANEHYQNSKDKLES